MLRDLLSSLYRLVVDGKECAHCGKILRNFPHAVEHHQQQHPDRGFDLERYGMMAEWEKVEPEELPPEVRESLDLD